MSLDRLITQPGTQETFTSPDGKVVWQRFLQCKREVKKTPLKSSDEDDDEQEDGEDALKHFGGFVANVQKEIRCCPSPDSADVVLVHKEELDLTTARFVERVFSARLLHLVLKRLAVLPDASDPLYVKDASFVRKWRLLLDEHHQDILEFVERRRCQVDENSANLMSQQYDWIDEHESEFPDAIENALDADKSASKRPKFENVSIDDIPLGSVVQETPDKLVASRDIQPFEVLVSAKPLAFVLNKAFKKHRCHGCLRNTEHLLPCHACSEALFCSGQCSQRAHRRFECSQGLTRLPDSTKDWTKSEARHLKGLVIALKMFYATPLKMLKERRSKQKTWLLAEIPAL